MSVENDVPEAAETTPCGQTGFTDSERYLAKIARKSFLSLWSYGNLFRNEALLKKSGNKKEICDLTVVFGNHIILFSDKACAFPSTGNLDVDWSRWYRNAVLENAKQVWGAERWILDHPENIFLDKDCSVRFPIDLPPRGAAIVHRVVVAHGSRERCTAEMDGIGSLMVVPHIVGTAHTDKQSDGGLPFAIGLVDAKKGYVHVLDDATLDIVLGSLDTVADFVAYLNKKEEFISTGKLLTAAGEEDLLAIYLQRMNDQEQHDFVIDPTMSVVTIAEGIWDHFEASPQRAAQIEANRISYEWDRMIERFAAHATAGTSELESSPGLTNHERALRILASEHRTRRRMLAGALIESIVKTPATYRATRTVVPSSDSEPMYVFLLLPHTNSSDYDKYRDLRRHMLYSYCMIAKLAHQDARDIIGLATESGQGMYRSEDIVYLDGRDWDEELLLEAVRIREEFVAQGWLKEHEYSHAHVKEYPDIAK